MCGSRIRYIAKLFLIATVCLVGALLVYRPLHIPRSYSPVAYRAATLKSLIIGIGWFYEEDNGIAKPVGGFPQFAEENLETFTRTRPEPFDPKSDIGIFLLLPPSLSSERPTMIAYTDASEVRFKKEAVRCAIILEGDEMRVECLREPCFQILLPSASGKKAVPALYYDHVTP